MTLVVSPTGDLYFSVLAFVFGAAWGSFLNVLIYRYPAEMSIVTPGSHCPACQTPLAAKDNIPIFGWLFLKGRCRYCDVPISTRYPLVELLTALLTLACYRRFGLDLQLAVAILFVYDMIVVAYIDFDTKEIYRVFSLYAIPFFALGAILSGMITWQGSLLGIAIGGGGLWLFSFVLSKAFYQGRTVMGLGDVFLVALFGAMFGPLSLAPILVIGSFLGTIYGLIAQMRAGKSEEPMQIPFGPFLSVGAVSFLLAGEEIVMAIEAFSRAVTQGLIA